MSGLLSLQDVAVHYGQGPVLQSVDLTVRAGEIITIVGPNGSGKSSLLRVMTGAVRPKRGRVLRQAGLRIGYVPQKLRLDPTFPMTLRRFLDVPQAVADHDADLVAERTGISGHMHKQIASLSGGLLQRGMLARAILRRPDVLLLDEPTQGLDQAGSAGFYELIEDLRNELNCAVVMVSHDLHVVMSASDRVICLNGHICCQGAPEVVSTAPEYRALFGRGTRGTMALYRHDHDHDHSLDHSHDHDHGHHAEPSPK